MTADKTFERRMVLPEMRNLGKLHVSSIKQFTKTILDGLWRLVALRNRNRKAVSRKRSEPTRSGTKQSFHPPSIHDIDGQRFGIRKIGEI